MGEQGQAEDGLDGGGTKSMDKDLDGISKRNGILRDLMHESSRCVNTRRKVLLT
jgi:hypothetical protein